MKHNVRRLREIMTSVCDIISIGPFGCILIHLPESILNGAMRAEAKVASGPQNLLLQKALIDFGDLPFLSIKSDGSPFPQVTQAKPGSILPAPQPPERGHNQRSTKRIFNFMFITLTDGNVFFILPL